MTVNKWSDTHSADSFTLQHMRGDGGGVISGWREKVSNAFSARCLWRLCPTRDSHITLESRRAHQKRRHSQVKAQSFFLF